MNKLRRSQSQIVVTKTKQKNISLPYAFIRNYMQCVNIFDNSLFINRKDYI